MAGRDQLIEAVIRATYNLPDSGETWCAAAVDAVLAALDTPHVAVFTADRWLIEHSIQCRLDGRMAECPYHAAVALIADDMQNDLGRYLVTGIDSEGLPSLEAEMALGG